VELIQLEQLCLEIILVVQFNVTGLTQGTTEVFVTGGTYTDGTATFRNNTGGTFVIGFSALTEVAYVISNLFSTAFKRWY
jgi:hypothetical protein